MNLRSKLLLEVLEFKYFKTLLINITFTVLTKITHFIINREDTNAIKFMVLNLGSRIFSALAQLYATTIFIKSHDQISASVIILLLGYMSWFQLSELGLSQTIQNKFNLRRISINNIISITLFHYLLLIIIAIIIYNTEILSKLLLDSSTIVYTGVDKKNFSIGAGLFMLASSNLILHRILLITGQGNRSNLLLLIQSLITILCLFIYANSIHISQLNSILIYVIPQILISLTIISSLIIRLSKSKIKKSKKVDYKSILKSASGFFIVGALSSVLLGLDYFFLSKYVISNEIISYHITTRFFYLSFIIYYAYLIHASRKIAIICNEESYQKINRIKSKTIFMGSFAVIAVYVLMLTLNFTGYMSLISDKTKISYNLMFVAFCYYLIRVYCDVNLVITNNLSHKKKLIYTYSFQIMVCLILMPILVKAWGTIGILIALSAAYLLGLLTQPKIKKCYLQ